VEGSGLGHLADGQKVSFDVEQDTRGPKAVNLQDA
jgi:cold shock CspA family protein